MRGWKQAAAEIGLETVNCVEDINVVTLKQVGYFQYLGLYVDSTKKEADVLIGKPWTLCTKMTKLWFSDPQRDMSFILFSKSQLIVLLYSFVGCGVTDILWKRLDDAYTILYRLYYDLLSIILGTNISCTMISIASYNIFYRSTLDRHLQFACHCWKDHQ